MDQYIECPNCKERIPITEALTKQAEESVRSTFELEMATKEASLRAQFESQLLAEKQKVEKETADRVSEKVSSELEELRHLVSEKDEKLSEARKREREFLKRQRELEDKEQEIDLEIERRLQQERQDIEEKVKQRIDEERHFKEAEKDKQLTDLRKQVDDLKRKLEQGSQQTQGEIAELELESYLRGSFPLDQIEPVGKGIRGADLLQRVHNSMCHLCGTIIWEVKNTKNWSDDWIGKLKDDQRSTKAEVAILVTSALPKDLNRFGCIEGVWVTDFPSAIGLATALREGLIQIESAKISTTDKSTKVEMLYTYLCGNEFKQRIEGIVEAFSSMQEDLDAEKRATLKAWAKREKQIYKVLENTVGMYGDVEGIIGAALPKVEVLELPDPSRPQLN